MTRPIEISIPKATGKLESKDFKELEEYIDNIKTKKGSLIQILHKAQIIFGYLPMEVQLFIARKLAIPGAEVFGVVSFYSYFTTQPSGKHTISVCMGTACFVRGADKIHERIKNELRIGSNQTTEDGLFTLKDVRCIGACGLAPVIMVDDKVYGRVKEDDVKKILDSYR